MKFLVIAFCLGWLRLNAAEPRVPAGYRVETIDIPAGITLGVGGLSWASTHELMICTREGEVWRFNAANNTWNLYAEGLHEPLGIYVERTNGNVFVMQR